MSSVFDPLGCVEVLYCEALEDRSMDSGLPQLIKTSSKHNRNEIPKTLITMPMTLIPKWYQISVLSNVQVRLYTRHARLRKESDVVF